MTDQTKGDVNDGIGCLIFDHETGTVLDAESCSVFILTDGDAELLAEGQLNMQTWLPLWGRPVVTDAIRDRVERFREATR